MNTNSQNPYKMSGDFLEFNQVLWMHLKNKIYYGDTRHPCYSLERSVSCFFDELQRLNWKKKSFHSNWTSVYIWYVYFGKIDFTQCLYHAERDCWKFTFNSLATFYWTQRILALVGVYNSHFRDEAYTWTSFCVNTWRSKIIPAVLIQN